MSCHGAARARRIAIAIAIATAASASAWQVFFFVLPGIPSGFLSVAGRRRFILLLHDTCGDVIFMFNTAQNVCKILGSIIFYVIDGVQLEV